MKKYITIFLFPLVCNFAFAQRFQSLLIQSNEPVVIRAKALTPVIIEFPNSGELGDIYGIRKNEGEDKDVRNFMGWNVAKSGNALIVTALPKAANTTIILKTKTDSAILDLQLDNNSIANKYSVTFADELARLERLKQEAAEKLEASKVEQAKINNDKNPLNKCNYYNYSKIVVRDSDGIDPIKACDDGKLTYFYFRDVNKQPLIYRGYVGEQREILTNQTTLDNGWVMVQGLSNQWNLRLGKNMVAVTRD